MHRRDLLARLAAGGAGALVVRASALAPPLVRVNVAVLDEPKAAAAGDCTVDTCSVRDACLSADAGHVCHQRDVCAIDESGDCTRDECTQSDTSNRGASCTDDRCDADSSLSCSGDACVSDKSGMCSAHDDCTSDKSGDCLVSDVCGSDSSRVCLTDQCTSDASGACSASDTCGGDSSGECAADGCTSDASDVCTATDSCEADASGACSGDSCVADSSGECVADECLSDKSGGCGDDTCTSDKSGPCTALDTCLSDSSAVCGDDDCRADSSAECTGDRCASDSSRACTQADVCVIDSSQGCVSDLCRRDADAAPCTADSCAPDLLAVSSRRSFTRVGRALRWLYEIAGVLALLAATARNGAAQTAIDAGCNATFFPRAVTLAATPVSPGSPKGAFLADFDGDGILEADTDGDGFDADDPELADRDGDGTRELPTGTPFAGTRRYTVFWVPDDAMIAATGFLKVLLTTDARVFGALRAAAGIEIAARGVVDVRGSAWLAENGEVRLSSALTGAVTSGAACTGLDPSDPEGLGAVLDSDLDGVADALEGIADADADGVPDWLDQDTATAPAPGGLGRVSADVAEGAAQRLDLAAAALLAATDPALPAAGRPAGGLFIFGVHDLRVVGLSPGETLALTIRTPIPVPPSSQYWRVDATGWRLAALGSNDGDATVTLALTDGGPDDRDGARDGSVREVGAVVLFARQPSTPLRRGVGTRTP